MHAALFAVHSFSCSLSPYLSHGALCAIEKHLHDQEKFKHKSAYCIAADLKEKFPFIESITCDYAIPGKVAFHIEGVEPLFKINENFVLTAESTLLAYQVFDPAFVQNLCSVEFPKLKEKNETISQAGMPALKKSLQDLPERVFASYQVCWMNELETYLCDKEESKFAIVCNAQTIPDESLLKKCATIKQELETSNAFKKKSIHRWVADIRFKDQIIVSSDKGGRYHG